MTREIYINARIRLRIPSELHPNCYSVELGRSYPKIEIEPLCLFLEDVEIDGRTPTKGKLTIKKLQITEIRGILHPVVLDTENNPRYWNYTEEDVIPDHIL